MNRQRIDKWLWHARVVRTRSDAAALVEAGHVRLNGKRNTAAGQPVRIGDVVTLALDRSVRVLEVAGFHERPRRAGALPRIDNGFRQPGLRRPGRSVLGLAAAAGPMAGMRRRGIGTLAAHLSLR